MISTIDEKTEKLRPVLAKPSALNKTTGGLNGGSKMGGAGQAGDFHVREAPLMDGAMLSQVRVGLQFLWNSYIYARDLCTDPWEFSVEWMELRRLGMTCNDVRWLIRQGLVRHAYEVTGPEDDRRRFVPCSSLTLSRRTCLVMTEEGCRLSQHFVEARGAEETAAGKKPATAALVGAEPVNGNAAVSLVTPKWDRDRRQLRVDVKIVKEFKVPAPNQEIVLGAFDEDHWPPKIDDPLPHKSGIVPQRRLHDTINSLNRRQRHRLLHFSADGLGSGIRWEYLQKQHIRD